MKIIEILDKIFLTEEERIEAERINRGLSYELRVNCCADDYETNEQEAKE